MVVFMETMCATAFGELVLEPAPVQGTLREPIIERSPAGGVSATYHWEAPAGHTFLYLNFTSFPSEGLAVARSNVDSDDIRGQGDALWAFLDSRLQEFSDQGLLGNDPCPIVHEVVPNDYSRRLPAADPRYIESDDRTKYYGFYLPNQA